MNRPSNRPDGSPTEPAFAAGAPSAGSVPEPSAAATSEKVWNQARSELSENEIARKLIPEASVAGVHEGDDSSGLRQFGRFVVFGGVLLGLGVPEIAAELRPYLAPLLVATLVFGLLRADLSRLTNYRKQALPIAGLLFALLVLSPIFVALEAKVVLVPYGLPAGIADGLVLAALSPPLLAAPAIAFLLGLDSLLALVVALIAHLLAPLTITVLAHWLVGPQLQISMFELMARLVLIIGTGFALGMALRQVKAPARYERQCRSCVDVMSVVTLTLLAIALMDGVAEMAWANPQYVMLAVACGFVLNPLLQLLGAFLFVKSGFQGSLTVGLLAGYRNTGVMIAALAGSAPPSVIAFLAIVQIPAFIIPLLSGPILKKVRTVGFDAP